MPRYSGAILSFAIIVICLGINLTQFPIAREMLNDSDASSSSIPDSHAEVSSPDSADSSITSDTVVPHSIGQTALQEADSAHQVIVPPSLVLQSTAQKEPIKDQDKKIESAIISPQEGTSVPPHGGSPSRISVSQSLVPSLPLVSNNGYEPIPSRKAKLRGATISTPQKSLTENKGEEANDETPNSPAPTSNSESETLDAVDENEEIKNDQDANLDTDFRLSAPRPAYGQKVEKNDNQKEQEKEKVVEVEKTTPSHVSSNEKPKEPTSDADAVPTVESEANPWSAIHVKIRPYEIVEAFRNSPLVLDVSHSDATQIHTQDPYAEN